VALLNLMARSDVDPAILHDSSLILHVSPDRPGSDGIFTA
jgi:hypothetical protein